jgi:sugar phosphate isomerase/epimerase
MEEHMKPILTGYFDHESSDINAQFEFARLHQLDTISLRMVNNYKLKDIDQKTYQSIISTVKKNRIKVICLDPNLETYDLYQEKRHQEAITIYREIMGLANKIKTPYIALRLPKFQSVIDEIEAIDPYMQDYILLAQQNHKKLVLIPGDGHKAQTYAYLIKKYKTSLLSVCFDPVYFVEIGEPNITNYRLLRKNISFLRANDCTLKGEPRLIGYGKTDFLKLAKKLLRDRFDGYIFIDNHLHELIYLKPVEIEKNFFKKLFTKSDKKQVSVYDDLKTQMKWHETEKNVTYDDIIDNQIKLLNYIFRN